MPVVYCCSNVIVGVQLLVLLDGWIRERATRRNPLPSQLRPNRDAGTYMKNADIDIYNSDADAAAYVGDEL